MVLPMLKHNQHIISQQIVELDVPSASDAHKLSQAVAQRLRSMTDVEALFDRFAKPEHTIKLARVEINLGDLSVSEWQEQLESRMVEQLTDVLKEATKHHSESSSTSEQGQGDVAQWLYFLCHGRLPSWAESVPDNWPDQWIQDLDSTQWQSLRFELTHNERVRHRMIHTLDDTSLVTVVENLLELHEVLQIFNLSFPTRLSRAQQLLWRVQFWQALLEPITGIDELERGIEFMRRLLQLQANFDLPSASTCEDPSIVSHLPEPWRNWLAAIQANTENSTSATLPGDNNPTADNESSKPSVPEALSETPTERSITSDPSLAPDKQSAATNDGSESSDVHQTIPPSKSPLHVKSDVTASRNNDRLMDIDEAIHINAAGSIILHPFLEELFRNTKLLDGRDFRDEASRLQAVHLLIRLTFGDEAIPEYELLLPKLLCGMAWQEPLPPVELSREERFACDELLDAVLGHWQALEGCSVNWMREQFFLRPARLEQVDEAWRLTVERRAQDVLLDRLPWGLGVIALPWRQGLIYVHWIQ